MDKQKIIKGKSIAEYARDYRAQHSHSKEWKDKRAEYQRGYAKRLKLDVVNHYSNGKNVCACCGEAGIAFLSIDHTNGGGRKHRFSLFKKGDYGGTRFYRWLRANGYPQGFQVLCYNCNFAKGAGDTCPHKL